MTAPRTVNVPAAMLVEFGCERRCQAEVDLAGESTRMSFGQMTSLAESAHKKAHKGEPVRVFRFNENILVRADVLAEVLV